MKKFTMGVVLAVAMILIATVPVFAQEGTFQGTVQSVDESAGTLTLLTSEGTETTVVVPEGTDFSAYPVGSFVLVSGDLSEEGVLTAASLAVISSEGDEDPSKPGFYCSNPEFTQPALGKLADTYEAEYGQVLSLYCQGGLGVGGVQLALAAGQAYGLSAEEVAAMRAEHLGWGQIWKQLQDTNVEPVTIEAQTGEAQKSNNPGQANKPDKPEKGNNGKSANAPGHNK